MAEHETIADIIAEMRRRSDEAYDGSFNYPECQENQIKYDESSEWADRLDAALKRELSKNVSKNGADFGQLGDAAKLREALAYLFTLIDMRKLVLDCDEAEEISAVQVMLDKCRAALSAPPRNCDRFETVKEAAIAFARERQDAPQPCPDFTFSAWLFAPATEKEGGAK